MKVGDEVLYLYEGDAPGSENWTHDMEAVETSEGQIRLCNVRRPTITVYRPRAEIQTDTAVIIAPGGGFHLLAWDHEGSQVAGWLNEKGITCFQLHYRTMPVKGDPHEALMAAARSGTLDDTIQPIISMAVQDGRNAVKWVREHASDYDISPSKVGFLGFSAGATLALGLAYTTPREECPDFLAPIYPHYRWIQERNIPPDRPPMFVAVAADDEFGFASHAIELNQDWTGAGFSQELHVYSRGGHGFGMNHQGLASDQWIEHFYAWLGTEGLVD